MGSSSTQTAGDAILEELAALLEASHALAPGTLVAARFEIVECIGVGGMGVVYRARDVDLGRNIAIKLRRDEAPGGQARLLGEARALASLSHPNVVSAYEVGKHEGAVFLAMELIEGETLRDWMRARRRTWREVVAVFRQAGAGLIAIHGAGLVYRDFKPDNVLVGADGRVRVADLGLARPMGHHEDCAGGVSGTPRYMAPELWQQGSADARSDQFAFCVALHEAFFGALPDDDAGEPRGETPRRIRAAVMRGLAVDPAERHPSMEALLRALAWDPAARRRRLALAVAVAGLAGAAAWGARAPQEAATACAAGDDRIRGGWSAGARAEAKASFLATGRPHAAGTWSRVEASLDAYADGYLAARRQTCAAPSSVTELQVACLDWRATGMAELVRVFRRADAEVVDRAVSAVASLESIGRCANAAALLGAPPLPPDPAARARVETALGRLEVVAALRSAGRWVEGAEAGRALVAEARQLGYDPLLARALVVTADQMVRSGGASEAEAMLREALPAAARGRDDEAAAKAATLLIWATGVEQTRHDEAVAMIPAAEAMAARAGGLSPADLDSTLGELAHMRGRYADALTAHEQALRRYEEAKISTPRLHAAWANMGLALLNLKRTGEAETALRRALQLCERQLGRGHPEAARILLTLGNAAYDARQLDRAAAVYQQSHDAYAAALGSDNIAAAIPLRQLARLEIHRGSPERAIAPLDRVLAISEQALGPEHPTTAEARFFKAVALYELGRFAESEDTVARAATAIEKALGSEHPRLVMYLLARAEMAERRQQPGEVRAAAARALAIARKAHGDDAPETAAPLALLGAAARLEGRREASMTALRRALELQTAAHGDEHLLTAAARVDLAEAMIHFGQLSGAIALLGRALPVIDGSSRRADHGEVRLLLARAHWGTGDRKRARELARAAHAECLSSCQASTRAEIAAWLRKQGRR